MSVFGGPATFSLGLSNLGKSETEVSMIKKQNMFDKWLVTLFAGQKHDTKKSTDG